MMYIDTSVQSWRYTRWSEVWIEWRGSEWLCKLTIVTTLSLWPSCAHQHSSSNQISNAQLGAGADGSILCRWEARTDLFQKELSRSGSPQIFIFSFPSNTLQHRRKLRYLTHGLYLRRSCDPFNEWLRNVLSTKYKLYEFTECPWYWPYAYSVLRRWNHKYYPILQG